MISTIGVVALGGALGAAARYGVNIGSVQLFGHGFPWATLIVNILGSFLMGVVIAKFAQADHVSHEMKTFVVTGFLGAFTTFSTFSLDAVTMWERGDLLLAFLYISASVIVSIGALFVALWIMKSFVS